VNYWLMKTEPDTFSISDLERVRIEPWSGVRSTFARFHMRKMEVGDLALFYHSSVIPPGAVGVAKIVRTKVVDQTQFDPRSQYFEPKATADKPIWDCVDVEYVTTFPHQVTLERMRADPMLADMPVLRIGRLSVQPCAEHEYLRVVELGQTPPPAPAPKVKAAPKKPAPKKAPVAKKPAKAVAKPKPAAKKKRR
jgi:predicted RNA-binding protein with PUA-like domain